MYNWCICTEILCRLFSFRSRWKWFPTIILGRLTPISLIMYKCWQYVEQGPIMLKFSSKPKFSFPSLEVLYHKKRYIHKQKNKLLKEKKQGFIQEVHNTSFSYEQFHCFNDFRDPQRTDGAQSFWKLILEKMTKNDPKTGH